ncbi:MAG: hypothetical protein A2667_03485 [Candidatus Wildermuthbacteria bacterium RIFCSPHIGHO2_01_FULL_47_27]|uniref:Uncharacterized protein n=2 Tax=Candidatus Wildermuthiibacteriota TaxID=1817923 RepID=A0A1G2RMK5_9BACT|nr:MAG: hypothetical protein UY15_C0008G0016 [Parcubacteria group bacterium GW2011_GWA2_47_9]OHA63529.1 MAG: hypothetical protein A2667_03485 [Candidatus Wildermuthbacteria bacterium RIFCSPHIGHO2_01_FULL_47_27]OHA67521.1 MAG: hypothetical protein A3D59_03840 [Candidatus Wildermuthbacteria bacterium RIFCSPHIGHO2_02_FULL_47_17]OHA74074.1 MAG: hypothetical protein A3A32_02160 [Candidatus Wildermuthbacteria bacterium RIFCSPLOWO2_01_FULL_48_35]OHA75056.1 MAG: hypothetical protein A3I38_03320 [Candid
MAITFSRQKRKQQYLILVFVVIIFVTLGVVWKGFMSPSAAPQSIPAATEPVRPPEINIDFELLDKLSGEEATQDLEEFPQIPVLPEGTIVGRENPFVQYAAEQIPEPQSGSSPAQ